MQRNSILAGKGSSLLQPCSPWRIASWAVYPLVPLLLTAPTAAHANDAALADGAWTQHIPGPTPLPAPANAISYQPLPDPSPISDSASLQGVLYLELILNGRATGQIIPVTFENGSIRLSPQDLQRQGVELHVNTDRFYLSDIADAAFTYHVAQQQISIDLPLHLLPSHHLSRNRKRLDITPANTAFLLNYDAFLSSGLRGGAPQASIFLEQRIAGQFGIASNSGLWRNSPRGGYKRYDSSFRTAHVDSATTWEFGDIITRSLANASAVRLGGVQISRDFAVRPDIITYPMPRFAGRAALPSTVELLVDGRSIVNDSIDPGQFLLDNMPLSTGAGEAQLVVTDMHGHVTTTQMPFYIANNLLAPGLTDFAISAGFFREYFAVRNFAYGDFAASASLRHGLTPWLTGEMRGEYSRDFWLVGAGAQSRIARFGVLSGSAAQSQHRGKRGHYMSAGYDYQSGRFSIALRHMRQSPNFRDLGTIDYFDGSAAYRQYLASLNLSLNRYGSFGLNYVENKNDGRPNSRYANIHWSRPVSQRGHIYARAGHDFASQGWSLSLALSLSLGSDKGSLSTGITHDSGAPLSYRANYNRAVPSDGGVGWNLDGSITENGSKNWRADMQWRTAPTEFRFGGSGFHNDRRANQYNVWAGASGGIAWIDGYLATANRLPSNFALVSTNGYAGIPVRYEYQLIGRTNKNGHLFIPNISPWYAGQISIDPLGLPADISAPLVERRIAVPAGRGVHVKFPVTAMQPFLATIRDTSGNFPAPGAPVYANGKLLTHMGWDGMLYLEDRAAISDNRLIIEQEGGEKCTLQLPPNNTAAADWTAGELRCLTIT